MSKKCGKIAAASIAVAGLTAIGVAQAAGPAETSTSSVLAMIGLAGLLTAMADAAAMVREFPPMALATLAVFALAVARRKSLRRPWRRPAQRP